MVQRRRACREKTELNTAVPFWGQTSQIPSSFPPKWDCSPKPQPVQSTGWSNTARPRPASCCTLYKVRLRDVVELKSRGVSQVGTRGRHHLQASPFSPSTVVCCLLCDKMEHIHTSTRTSASSAVLSEDEHVDPFGIHVLVQQRGKKRLETRGTIAATFFGRSFSDY